MSERKIILLSEIIETRVRKEKELEYYQRQLDELQRKMFFVKKEIDLTNVIIDIIEHEKVIDIKEYVYDKIESKYE
jgi:hypothetical protein